MRGSCRASPPGSWPGGPRSSSARTSNGSSGCSRPSSSATIRHERGALTLDVVANVAGRDVIVDDPAGLHRRVDRRRPHEPEAGSLQPLRELPRLRRLGNPLRGRRTVAPVLPHELLERRSRLPQREDSARIRDRGFDLPAMPDDPRVAEQPLDVALAKAGDTVRVEVAERTTEVLALPQNGQPRQPGLKALEAQPLVQPVLVGYRTPPL